MMMPNCKHGDIVVINQSLAYGGESKKYKALVLWNGVNGQPLLTHLDRWAPYWSTYKAVEEVVGHVNLEEVMRNAV